MSTFFIKLNDWLSRNMSIVVLSGLCLGFFVHITDSSFLREIVVILFAYMTFITALSTSFKEFIAVLRRPWIPLWILILVHFITPLTAWMVGMVFYPNDPDIRMGYLIGASIPIGVTSIIWTSLVKGELGIAFVAVTLDTFIVPAVLPLFFHIVIGQTINISYSKMFIDLMFMVTVPTIIGMLLHDWTKGRVANFAKSIGGATSKVALFVVILINSAVVMPQINWDTSILKTLLVTLFVVSSSFFVGYLGSFALKKPTQSVILTMMYNVGIRNNACGLVIALTYFPPRVAVPMTLSILYQQPIATMISHLYKRLKKI